MSTRSGKSIHKSLQDDHIDALQTECKTRRKKQKKQEDMEVVKKRDNYVSYPTDEDASIYNKPTETNGKSAQRTRRSTLKEFNVDVLVSNTDAIHGNIRETRSVKKLKGPVSGTEVENIENTEEPEIKPIANKKKTKKKIAHKKVSGDKQDMGPQAVSKKKGSKKKKKSTSIIVNDFERGEDGASQNGTGMINMSNNSAESFRSAINSPCQGNVTVNGDKMNIESNNEINEIIDNMKAAGSTTNGEYTQIDNKVMVSQHSENNGCSDNLNTTFNKTDDKVLNSTGKKETRKRRKYCLKKNVDRIVNISNSIETKSTFDMEANPQNSTFNNIFSKEESLRSSPQIEKKLRDSEKSFNISPDRNSQDKDPNVTLNTTFDTETKAFDKSSNDFKLSSLTSSNAVINTTYDKSDENSRISITSDESKTTENILNLTPMIIESSIDESLTSENKKTPEASEVQAPFTPLKREGTFTKDSPDVKTTPKPKVSIQHTPTKQKSLSSPGCTPFLLSRSSQKEKSILNVTQSMEKSLHRRSSLVEMGPRLTRVMFCSPANTPSIVTQMKGKVIKSNLKGSNKSFVFDDSVSVSEAGAGARKRSLTQGEADTRAKRKRLADGLQHSVDRLSRPRARTLSAAAKLANPGSPAKKAGTPSKPKAEGVVGRTKLPNFAALHQRRFARMESLDECQERRARRARQLLTPTGGVALLERISPKGTPPEPAGGPSATEPTPKSQTPSKVKPLTLESLRPGYTRFGFKLDMDVNPFSCTAPRAATEPRDTGTRAALPSRAGRTGRTGPAARRVESRTKSLADKRDAGRKESRVVIKGVRTNRRFELQMQLRNIKNFVWRHSLSMMTLDSPQLAGSAASTTSAIIVTRRTKIIMTDTNVDNGSLKGVVAGMSGNMRRTTSGVATQLCPTSNRTIDQFESSKDESKSKIQ